MNNSPIEFIRPENLNSESVKSWFSLKNPAFGVEGSTIPGMNVGLNSKEPEHIIQSNFKYLAQAIDTPGEQIALARQVHQTEVRLVDNGGIYEGTDGFISVTPGLALAIQVADCGAVLFGDAENKVIGAAHAGWRGAVGGIVLKTIQKMMELGAEAESIRVFVSPCLAQHNFEVGDEVAKHFSEHLVDRVNYAKPHVDLKGLIKNQLLDSGIREEYIQLDDRCTIDHESLFYSYRREGEKSGRMVGVIKLSN